MLHNRLEDTKKRYKRFVNVILVSALFLTVTAGYVFWISRETSPTTSEQSSVLGIQQTNTPKACVNISYPEEAETELIRRLQLIDYEVVQRNCDINITDNPEDTNSASRIATYQLAVVGRKDSPIKDITSLQLDELINSRIADGLVISWAQSENPIIEHRFSGQNLSGFIDHDEIRDFIKLDSNHLGLMPITENTTGLKVVTVDGYSPIEQDIPSLRYPLSYSIWYEGEDSNSKKVVESVFAEIQGTQTEYEPQQFILGPISVNDFDKQIALIRETLGAGFYTVTLDGDIPCTTDETCGTFLSELRDSSVTAIDLSLLPDSNLPSELAIFIKLLEQSDISYTGYYLSTPSEQTLRESSYESFSIYAPIVSFSSTKSPGYLSLHREGFDGENIDSFIGESSTTKILSLNTGRSEAEFRFGRFNQIYTSYLDTGVGVIVNSTRQAIGDIIEEGETTVISGLGDASFGSERFVVIETSGIEEDSQATIYELELKDSELTISSVKLDR